VFETTLVHKVLAAAAGCTFSLAVGVGVGAVPHPGDDTRLSAASASASALEPTFDPAHTRQASIPAPEAPTTTSTTVAAPAPTVAPATVPKVTTPPTTRAPRPATTVAPAGIAPPAAAAAPAAPAAPTKAARRTPSDSEVQAAIAGLKQRIGGLLLLVSPTPAQIAQAGDQVCTAFDGGQTFTQVKATGLSMIPASIKVAPATADWAVRQAVALYCPGHASKLV
jgi:hypothetical protein